MLHVHHAARADQLVTTLADVLRAPAHDPFAAEVVAVHSRGIERWVAQQLALTLGSAPGRSDGVAANVRFPFPGTLVGSAIAAATARAPGDDPWRPERSVWPLLEVVEDAHAAHDHELLGPLTAHLVDADGDPSERRYAAVRRVADLFDRYAVHRPTLIRAWAADRDVDAAGQPLDGRARWQAPLWRALRNRIGVPSGPERLTEATAALRAGHRQGGAPLELDLPDRLTLFGLTALPATYLEVLTALAAGPTASSPDGRDVHLFLLHPSPALWERVDQRLRETPATPTVLGLPSRDLDPTRDLPRNPLLATWGRDAREMQLTVRAVVGAGDDPQPAPVPDPAAPRYLLHRLQAGVHDDLGVAASGTADDRPQLAPDDRSVQVHRCHGHTRQVEVLRDVLLDLLSQHPDLEPRDIIVLCPDIETFAPLVEAVFGSHAIATDDDHPDGPAATLQRGGPGDLRVQLADRSLKRTNPVLRVAADLLELADGRVTASAVLDLLARAPVRRRFHLDDQDLARLEAWLQTTGIRWGLDDTHRRALGVPTGANTWRSGLDRLLVGVAVADERLRTVGGVVPEDDVEGQDVDLAGRLAELLDRLDQALGTLTGPQPIAQWQVALTRAVDDLCRLGTDDRWQRLQLGRVLDAVVDAARAPHTPDTAGRADPTPGPDDVPAPSELPLSLPEVRALLEDRLGGGPSRTAHRTGHLTVCTLVPMRSVPHRVVVLLGMDDEVFPRRTVPDGDDLLARHPLVGDRDARTEDRQLLLDALLAAGDHLVVVTTGHDPRTNDAKPPAVPIGELLDTIDRTVRSGLQVDGAEVPASTCVTVDHPLQPSDPRRFTPGGIGHPARPFHPEAPFGFDHDDLRAAQAQAGPTAPVPPFVPHQLPPHAGPALEEDADVDEVRAVELRSLTAFAVHPCDALLRQRLGLSFPRSGEVPDDAVPTELPNGLPKWAIGDRLLREVLRGGSLDRALEIERARGTLPPGHLGDDAVADLCTTVEVLLARARQLGVAAAEPGRAVAVDVRLPSGRRLVGAVDEVVGTVRRRIAFSRLGAKHRLQAWIDVLALTACDPRTPWTAATLGRARTGASKVEGASAVVSLSRLGPHDGVTHRSNRNTKQLPSGCLGSPSDPPETRQQRALTLLDDLLDLRDRGLAGPLPLPCATAAAYAHAVWDREIGILGQRNLLTNARSVWTTEDRKGTWDREDRDDANRRVLGDLTLEELLDLPPLEGEDGDGWFAEEEPGRFGRLARRVWFPLLDCEQLEDHA